MTILRKNLIYVGSNQNFNFISYKFKMKQYFFNSQAIETFRNQKHLRQTTPNIRVRQVWQYCSNLIA